MKTQLKDVFLAQPTQFNPAVPRWVSEMGLEWLYNLLAKSEDLWRSPVRQN
jgi:UDP-N-acetyl-D-mannosaminuronic acid transferase (WecB/TagA/CpsF family)